MINVEFIPMRDIAQTLPPNILPCSVDWGISVRGELVDIVRLLFSDGEPVERLVEGLLQFSFEIFISYCSRTQPPLGGLALQFSFEIFT